MNKKKIITIGSHIQTTEEYKKKMYNPLYSEEILDGIVLNIDNSNVVTYKLLKSSCNFNKKFNYHMESWKEGSIKEIGLGWLKLKEN